MLKPKKKILISIETIDVHKTHLKLNVKSWVYTPGMILK